MEVNAAAIELATPGLEPERERITIVDMFLTRSRAKDRYILDETYACRAKLLHLGPLQSHPYTLNKPTRCLSGMHPL